MDIIDIPLIERNALGPQTENWRLDPEEYWTFQGRMHWNDLASLVDEGPLWINGHSTYWGLNDQVPVAEAAGLGDSLRLIRVEGLTLKVYAPGRDFGDSKRKVQAAFEFGQLDYRLRVTDPQIERAYLAKNDGYYPVGESYLTVSLGEPYKEAYYKLVAAIITKPLRSQT